MSWERLGTSWALISDHLMLQSMMMRMMIIGGDDDHLGPLLWLLLMMMLVAVMMIWALISDMQDQYVLNIISFDCN